MNLNSLKLLKRYFFWGAISAAEVKILDSRLRRGVLFGKIFAMASLAGVLKTGKRIVLNIDRGASSSFELLVLFWKAPLP